MSVTTFLSALGSTIGQSDGSSQDYSLDAFGSVGIISDATGSPLRTLSYTPYGQKLSDSDPSDNNPFLWLGAHGYIQGAAAYSDFYVRSRHYSSQLGLWTTVDAYWPSEPAYNYALGNPVSNNDPSGAWTIEKGACGKQGAHIVTDGPNDQRGIASGSENKVQIICGFKAIDYCKQPFKCTGGKIVVVNGSFYNFRDGQSLGPMKDCRNHDHPNGIDPDEQTRGKKITYGRGYNFGRFMFSNGLCIRKNIPNFSGYVGRTALVSAKGRIKLYVFGEGAAPMHGEDECDCFSKLPIAYVYDGSGSSQIHTETNGVKKTIEAGDGRCVNNWFWTRMV